MESAEIKQFDAIVDFVRDLDIVFGETHKNVRLYRHLLDKTTHTHVKPAQKHIESFRKFVDENICALREKDASKLTEPVITYTDRVYVDVADLLSGCDTETKSAIWNHLITFNALCNPSEQSLALMHGDGDDFIEDIINTVTNSIDPSTVGGDPMAIAMGLVSSGKLSGIISSMSDKFASGSIDPDKMLKKVTEMYSSITKEHDGAPDIATILSTFGNINGSQNNK